MMHFHHEDFVGFFFAAFHLVKVPACMYPECNWFNTLTFTKVVCTLQYELFLTLCLLVSLSHFIQGCGNTMPDLFDLVPFHSGQVKNFYLLVLGQVQMY